MGNTRSASGRSGPLAACAPSRGQRTPEGNLVVSVVRSSGWGLGDEEDIWPVEVRAAANVAELKAKIEELYDVPLEAQLLSTGSSADVAHLNALEDAMPVERFATDKIYLFPSEAALSGALEDEDDMPIGEDATNAMAAMTEGILAAAQEQMEVSAALEESLRGVTYRVIFHRPEAAGGAAAGKRVTLTLDALALVGDVQQMVELELFGRVGLEPAFLHFEGVSLPPHCTLFQAGIENGSTVEVLKDAPQVMVPEELLAGLMGDSRAGHHALSSPHD